MPGIRCPISNTLASSAYCPNYDPRIANNCRGDTQRFEEGSSVVEVMNTVHRCQAVGGPVDIVVFYAGAEGIPTTVLPGTDDARAWSCDAME
jgi:hypothetical protein